MGALLASVLPLAVGAAVSPTLLALQLLVLTGATRPRARAWAVVAGSALVLAVYSVLGLTVLNHLHPDRHGLHSLRGAVIMFVAAGLLAVLALRSLIHRPTPAEQHTSRTAGRLATAPTGWFLGVGALGTDLPDTGLLCVITLLPVLAPVVVVTVLGTRAEPALEATHAFVSRHARQIGIAIEVVFAVYLVWRGFGELP